MPKPQPSFVRRWLLGNLRNKGTSLVFAILIWAYAFSHTKEIEQTSVRVSIVSGSAEQVVLETRTEDDEPFTGEVVIDLEGPRNLLRVALDQVSAGEFVVNESGLILLEEREGYPALPPGVDVVKATPKFVNVELDTRKRRKITIKPTGLIVNPSRRFRAPLIDDFRFEPASVTVEGPESLLGGVSVQFRDQRVDVDVGEWSALFPLVIAGEGADHREFRLVDAPEMIKASVKLKSALTPRKFTVPIRFGLDPSSAVATAVGPIEISGPVAPLEMTCRGTEEALDELQTAIDTGSFQIWIPYRETIGTFDTVESSSFRWPESGLPAEIERESITFDQVQIPIKVDRVRDDDESGEQE